MAKESPEVEEAAAEVAVSAESLRSARPSTDANVVILILVGVLGTLICSFGTMPFKNSPHKLLSYLDGMFNRRGPVQYGELLMSFMTAAIIYLKSRIVRNQLKVVASNPIPVDVDLGDDAQVQQLKATLASRDDFSWSILLNRLDRCISLWLASKDVGRVSGWVGSESSRDSSTSDSSYALSRVLIWAIPIMGFIGTVQGLAASVNGFSVLGGSAGVNEIKQAIGQVTVGLAVAFDTTLLALVLTTLLMFPLSAIQRREENLFVELDNYIDDLFLAKLPHQESQPIVIDNLEDSIEAAFRRYIPDPDRYDEVFTRAIDKAAASVETRFNGLSKNYEATLRDLTERLGANLTAVGDSMKSVLQDSVGELRKQEADLLANRRLAGEQETERFKTMLLDVQQSSTRMAEQFRQSAESLQASASEGMQRSVSAAQDLATRMGEVAKLAEGIQDLLKIQQAVDKSLAGITASEDFKETLGGLRRHLDATTAFCNRMNKPRVIMLREESA